MVTYDCLELNNRSMFIHRDVKFNEHLLLVVQELLCS